MRTTFRNTGTAYYEFVVDGSTVQSTKYARIDPGQSKFITVPSDDVYRIAGWNTDGNPIFGIFLPL